jgi:four helix bundle protein
MFLFEKLDTYQKSLAFTTETYQLLKSSNIDKILKNQLQRAATSITLNIAEGSGRFTQKDKNSFYVNARGSVLECVSIFQILLKTEQLDKDSYNNFYLKLEELAKMISGLIKTAKI